MFSKSIQVYLLVVFTVLFQLLLSVSIKYAAKTEARFCCQSNQFSLMEYGLGESLDCLYYYFLNKQFNSGPGSLMSEILDFD